MTSTRTVPVERADRKWVTVGTVDGPFTGEATVFSHYASETRSKGPEDLRYDITVRGVTGRRHRLIAHPGVALDLADPGTVAAEFAAAISFAHRSNEAARTRFFERAGWWSLGCFGLAFTLAALVFPEVRGALLGAGESTLSDAWSTGSQVLTAAAGVGSLAVTGFAAFTLTMETIGVKDLETFRDRVVDRLELLHEAAADRSESEPRHRSL